VHVHVCLGAAAPDPAALLACPHPPPGPPPATGTEASEASTQSNVAVSELVDEVEQVVCEEAGEAALVKTIIQVGSGMGGLSHA
jgi:hypothetical protein